MYTFYTTCQLWNRSIYGTRRITKRPQVLRFRSYTPWLLKMFCDTPIWQINFLKCQIRRSNIAFSNITLTQNFRKRICGVILRVMYIHVFKVLPHVRYCPILYISYQITHFQNYSPEVTPYPIFLKFSSLSAEVT